MGRIGKSGRIVAARAVTRAAKTSLLAGTAIAALTSAGPVWAEPVEKVVVTAQRRAESSQRVPISIIGLNEKTLREADITETQDLQFHVPNLQASGGGQNGQRVFIRGIGPNVVGSGVDGNVAYYRNGVYLTRQFSAEVPFLDVQRIEVLRGPQGALYGRNATGGSINVIQKSPTFDTTLDAETSYGTDNDWSAQATVNLGLGDSAGLRVSGAMREADNYMKNLLRSDRDGYNDYWQAQGAFLVEPADNVSLELRGDIIDADQLNFAPLKMVELDVPNVYGVVDFNPFVPGIQPIPTPNIIGEDFSYESAILTKPYKTHEEWGVSAKATIDFESATLTSLTAYRDMEMSFAIDTTGNSSTFGIAPGFQDSTAFSQEVQLASAGDGPLEWVIGGYYLEEVSGSTNGALDPNAAFRTDFYPALAFVLVYREGEVETEAYALFGQASYSISDDLRVTVGGRASWENKSATFLGDANGTIFGGLIPGTQTAGEESWFNFSPKVGVEYFPDDSAMLYASATRGFKSGGYNTAQDQPPFDEEGITSYEIGVKKSWADGRLITNAAGFYMDYKDLQVQQRFASGSTFVSLITNAASTTIKGLEAEVIWRATENLTLSSATGILDATFEDFLTNLPGDPPGAPPTDLSGNALTNAPEFTTTLSGTYTVPFEWGASLSLRADYRYQTEVFFDPKNFANESQDGYALLNARIALAANDGLWEVAVLGQNLTDEAYKTSTLEVVGFGTVVTYGRPRFVGAMLSLRL